MMAHRDLANATGLRTSLIAFPGDTPYHHTFPSDLKIIMQRD